MDRKQLEELLKELKSGNIDFGQLAVEFPGVSNYFDGTNPGKVNEYDNGVVSVVIEGSGNEMPSTFGYIPIGKFEFNTGENQETMHFLLGNLMWGVGKESLVIPSKYEKLVIPKDNYLILTVNKPSLYICDYAKK